MGFLLGAFGKLNAGRRVRDLQARMMRVQTKARRVTRQIEQMSKAIETQKKMEINTMTAQSQMAETLMPFMASGMANIQFDAQRKAAAQANGGNDPFGGAVVSSEIITAMQNGMDPSAMISGMAQGANMSKVDQAYMQQYMGVSQNMKAYNSMMLAQMKNSIEERYENLNDTMLEPLKMEEDSLQTEKDSLESQIQIAQADYEACKKMEQADAKNLAPNYTGQG